MTSVLSIFDPKDVRHVHQRIFKATLIAIVGQLDTTFPKSMCTALQSVSSRLVNELVLDSPELRAWLHSVDHMSNVFSRRIGDVATLAIHHIRLDDCDAARIADLLRFQAVGILIADALECGRDLQFETSVRCPPYMALASVGVFDFPDSPPGLSLEVRKGTMCISGRGFTAVVSARGEVLEIQGNVRFSPAVLFTVFGLTCEVPIHDPALFQPAFQTLPQVAGYAAATRFAHRIEEAACWLDRLDLPNLRGILGWCRAFLALAGFGHCSGSASRFEALGMIYLPSQGPMHELAECFLHEAMHQHLFRLDAVAPLFRHGSDTAERYYSPWRDDPRPLIMTLHGAYVFTAVAEIYSRCVVHPEMGVAGEEASAMVYQRARQAITALDVISKYGTLTSIGRRVALQTFLHATSLLESSRLSPSIRDAIDSELAAHREVCRDYLT